MLKKKLIPLLLISFVVACDSGCISTSADGSQTIRSFDVPADSVFYNENVSNYALTQGFFSEQAYCDTGAPINTNLDDYWYDTGLIFDNSSTYEGKARGSVSYCQLPDEIYDKQAAYVFDTINSDFVTTSSSTKQELELFADDSEITSWFNEGITSTLHFRAHDELNRIQCEGKYFYGHEHSFLLGAGQGDSRLQAYPYSSSKQSLGNLSNKLTSIAVPKGCVLNLDEKYGSDGSDMYVAYPTLAEWNEGDYYAFHLSLGMASYDNDCDSTDGTYRYTNCLHGIRVQTLDPNRDLGGYSCRVKASSHYKLNNVMRFKQDQTNGPNTLADSRYTVKIPVGDNTDYYYHFESNNNADAIMLSQNCKVTIYPHNIDSTPNFTLYHPNDWDPNDNSFPFNPSEYISYYLNSAASDSSAFYGGLQRQNYYGNDDNSNGNNFNDEASGYVMWQDPDWEGGVGTYYPKKAQTVASDPNDPPIAAVNFADNDDHLIVYKDEFSDFVDFFASEYSLYFDFKINAASTNHSLYSILQGYNYYNQVLGDNLYIDGSNGKLYFAHGDEVVEVPNNINFKDGARHNILMMREADKVKFMLDADYDNIIEVALVNSSLANVSSLHSVTLGNILAFDAETGLLNVVDANYSLNGYLYDFQVFEDDFTYEELIDFTIEQKNKWGNFVCDSFSNYEAVRMRIGDYVSDIEVFDSEGIFVLPGLTDFYRTNSDGTVEQADSVSNLSGHPISFNVSDPLIDFCLYQNQDQVKEEYANNAGQIIIEFRSTSGFTLLGNLYDLIVKPIERVLSQDLFQRFFLRIVVADCEYDDNNHCMTEAKTPLFRRLLNLALVGYVASTGISLLFGLVQINKYELMRRIMLVGIIYTLFSPTSWEFFNFYIIYFFQNGAKDLAALVNQSVFGFFVADYSSFVDGEIIENSDFSSIFDPLEIISAMIMTEEMFMKVLSMLFTPVFFGFLMILMTLYSFFLFFYIAFKVMVAYATVLVIMAVGIILAPFYFLLILFKVTAGFFDKWLSLMIASMLQIIILSATVTFFCWIIYAFLASIFSYAACWEDIISCCNTVPGVKFTLLQFYVPSGYGLMLGRFGYNDVISSTPEFEAIAILLLFVLAFEQFIEFSLNLGQKLAGNSGMSIGAMTSGIDRAFRNNVVRGGLKNIENVADEVTRGEYSKQKQRAKIAAYDKTIGKVDEKLFGIKAKDKQVQDNKIKDIIKKSKEEKMQLGGYKPDEDKDSIKAKIRSELENSGVSSKEIDKITNSKKLDKKLNEKGKNLKGPTLRGAMLPSFMKPDNDVDKMLKAAAEESPEAAKQKLEEIKNRVVSESAKSTQKGRLSNIGSEKRLKAKLDRVAKSYGRAMSKVETDKKKDNAEDNAKISKSFARFKAAVDSVVNGGTKKEKTEEGMQIVHGEKGNKKGGDDS